MAPLVNDIGTSIGVLQRDFPSERVRGQSRAFQSFNRPWDGGSSREGVVVHRLSLSARFVVSNPNLLLADQLGFINPAVVVWDAVPYSFVVDWFLPVGKFLQSFSNDFGITLIELSKTMGSYGSMTYRHISEDNGNVPKNATGFSLDRTIPGSFPMPGFFSRVRLPDADLWHCATSFALMFSKLQSLGKRE